MEEGSDERDYGVFVNKIKSEAIGRFGNVNIDNIIRKYEAQYGSRVYGLLERMREEGKILRVENLDKIFYVPLINDQTFTISDHDVRPGGIKL